LVIMFILMEDLLLKNYFAWKTTHFNTTLYKELTVMGIDFK